MNSLTNCRSCHSEKLTDILSLGDQYLSDFIAEGEAKPARFPLNLVKCGECSLLQLKETTPASELYTSHYGYRSGINQTMRKELGEIVKSSIEKQPKKSDLVVVDIGANDGTLLSNYPDTFYRIGFEPVEKLSKDCAEHANVVINNFFNAKEFYEVSNKKADIITCISMFYDLDDPCTFVSDLNSILADDGVLVIQQNYLVGMLEKTAFDNICHEHLEYYSLQSLEHLLNRHGLEVFDVVLSEINGGSFRVYVRHMNNVQMMRVKEGQLKLDKDHPYFVFGMKVNQIKDKLSAYVKEEVKQGKKVYIYGASTRGNTILQYCGLDNTLITGAAERNPEKWGKKIASVDIPIVSEEEARKDADIFLVLPWFFREEIEKREADFVSRGKKLIFPLPEFEVVG